VIKAINEKKICHPHPNPPPSRGRGKDALFMQDIPETQH
jgi:hypothetical protein